MASREKNQVIVRYVLDQRHSAADAAARFGVSRQWVHVLVQRYLADGRPGRAHAALESTHEASGHHRGRGR